MSNHVKVVELEPEWLTRDEASDYARLPVSTMDKARRNGELEYVKPHRRVLINRHVLDAWLRSFTVAAVLLALAYALACAGCCLGIDVASDGLGRFGLCPFSPQPIVPPT